MKVKLVFLCTLLAILLMSVPSKAVDVLSWGKEAAFSGHVASVVAISTDQVGVYLQGWKFEVFDTQKTREYLPCLRVYHKCRSWGCSVDPSGQVLYGFKGCDPGKKECSFIFKAFIVGNILGLKNDIMCTLKKPLFVARWSSKNPEFTQGFSSQDELEIYQNLKNGMRISAVYFYPLEKGKASLIDVMYEKGPLLTKFVEGNYKFFRVMLKEYKKARATGYKYPSWWKSFEKYNYVYPGCEIKGTFWQGGGGLVKVNCGAFNLEYSRTDLPKGRFRIEGNFVNQINSRFISIIEKKGIRTSSEIDFAPLLINYIIDKTPPTFWVKMGWRYYITHQEEFSASLPNSGIGLFLSTLKNSDSESDWIYLEKVLITTSRLMDMINNADFKTLNMIIEDFIKEKVQ